MSLCLQIKELLLVTRLNILFSLESGSLYACLLLVVTSISDSPKTTIDGADSLTYIISFPVCILFAVRLSSTKIHVYGLAKESHQGLLPTLMHVYVGLDLGVKNEEIKNSFAPGFNMHRVGSGVSEFERGLHEDVMTVPPQRAPSIFLQLEPELELEMDLPALPP